MKRITRRNEAGVSMVEAAIVLPIALLLVFAIIEYGRWVSVRSMAEAAALRALGVAATVDGLTLDPSTQKYKDAYKQVVDTARAEVTRVFVTDKDKVSNAYLARDPELILPPGPAADIEQRLTVEPMKIHMQINYSPFLGRHLPILAERTIDFTVAGFREPRQRPSLAIPVDCHGNLYGSASFKYDSCLCNGAHQYWDPEARSCLCNSPYLRNVDESGVVSCTCPPNRVCECNLTAASCGAGTTFDAATCSCKCTQFHSPVPNSNPPTCTLSCPNDLQPMGDTCGCSTACPTGTQRENSNTCNCVCKTAGADVPSGDACNCSLLNNGWTYTVDSSGCKCTDTNDAHCPGQQFATGYGTACGCGCPGNLIKTTDGCGCKAPKVVSGNNCVCAPCASGTVLVDGNACACCSATTPVWNGTKCNPCPTGTMPDGTGKCVVSCPQGTHAVDSTHCCATGYDYYVNGACSQCPKGQILERGICHQDCRAALPDCKAPSYDFGKNACICLEIF